MIWEHPDSNITEAYVLVTWTVELQREELGVVRSLTTDHLPGSKWKTAFWSPVPPLRCSHQNTYPGSINISLQILRLYRLAAWIFLTVICYWSFAACKQNKNNKKKVFGNALLVVFYSVMRMAKNVSLFTIVYSMKKLLATIIAIII